MNDFYNFYSFKIYSSNISDLNQKEIINRIKLVKSKFNKLNVILPIQKHTNKILKLSQLLNYNYLLGNSYLEKIRNLDEGFDGIYFDNKDIYLLKHFALGVLTADCLPIVILILKKSLYTINNLANLEKYFIIGSILHAGWKGIFNNIIYNFFNIVKNYLKNESNIKVIVYIGPCIRDCCYEIKEDLIKKLNINSNFYYLKDKKIYLNLPSIVKYQIKQYLKQYFLNLKNRIELENRIEFKNTIELDLIDVNKCTYCSNNYFSYRKGNKKERNITILSA
jgi:copper oxidase (laccase) domain-containing protein